ncbi:unnamed protein product [Ambrosiozyma monospora]|uniref:Unnamed protein product n=1 Tax=Ambrosiozyma monospora TaxID=43982 RepID=A0A9W6Z0K3_AMBMO|nr:unnamed protein product [Ambrosiozyma monospora]
MDSVSLALVCARSVSDPTKRSTFFKSSFTAEEKLSLPFNLNHLSINSPSILDIFNISSAPFLRSLELHLFSSNEFIELTEEDSFWDDIPLSVYKISIHMPISNDNGAQIAKFRVGKQQKHHTLALVIKFVPSSPSSLIYLNSKELPSEKVVNQIKSIGKPCLFISGVDKKVEIEISSCESFDHNLIITREHPENFSVANKNIPIEDSLNDPDYDRDYFILGFKLIKKYPHEKGALSYLIASLLDYHPVLDNIMSMVLKELEFDQDIFYSKHLSHVINFIISRSVQLNCFRFNSLVNEIPEGTMQVFDLFQHLHVCSPEVAEKLAEQHLPILQHVESLSIWPDTLQRLLAHDSFQSFIRLRRLEVVVNLPRLEWDASYLRGILNKWKQQINLIDTEIEEKQQRSLKLMFNVTDPAPHELSICNYFRDLSHVIAENKEDFHVSVCMDADESAVLSIFTLYAFKLLVDECQYLEYLDDNLDTKTYDFQKIQWVSHNTYSRVLHIKYRYKTYHYPQIAFASMPLLRELWVLGDIYVPPLFFENLPATLVSLRVNIDDECEDSSIKLPANLRYLYLKTVLFPEIANADELNLIDVTVDFLTETLEYYDVFKNVKSSIFKFPSTIEKLKLCGLEQINDHEPPSYEEKLSFAHLPKLKTLAMKFGLPLDYGCVSLPSIQHLELYSTSICENHMLQRNPKVKNQHSSPKKLPPTIESLVVNCYSI